MDKWQEFGRTVRKRREELGISQEKIATALGIDQAKVSLIERGARKVDSVKELPLLAKVLRCSISSLCQADEVANEAQVQDDPVRVLVTQYFPDANFDDLELQKIRQFLQPVLTSFVENADFKKKAQ